MLAKRFQIALMLLAGYDYQAIKNYTKVSEQTIARVANKLIEIQTPFKKTAREIIEIKHQKLEKIRRPKKYSLPGDFTTPATEKVVEEVAWKIRQHKKKQSISK